jgi:hypothetical protein
MSVEEIKVVRLLHRLQLSLEQASYSERNETDSLRMWSYVEYASKLLQDSKIDEERRGALKSKLDFISQLMKSSDEMQGIGRSTTVSDYSTERRVMLSTEEHYTRKTLFPPQDESPPILKESELRRQLGLGAKKVQTLSTLSLAAQLEQDEMERDKLTEEIMEMVKTLKDNSGTINSSLKNDQSRIDYVGELMDKNTRNVQTELSRMDQLYQSTSTSCRTLCIMILSVCVLFIATWLVIKMTPSSR